MMEPGLGRYAVPFSNQGVLRSQLAIDQFHAITAQACDFRFIIGAAFARFQPQP